MTLDHAQLSVLVAVLREGSFEAAARVYNVTPSAISQRIKQLEERVGAVVVVRSAPCRATPLGEALFRHGQQIELLEQDLLADLGTSATAAAPAQAPVSIAVNADSLATWILPGIAEFTAQAGLRVEIVVDDQDHTAAWLRSGRVLGAVTGESRPVQGCRVEPLGAMRYRANASPACMQAWFPDGFNLEAVNRAPVIAFDRKDHLHERFLAAVQLEAASMRPLFVPSPQSIVEACVAGLGWSLNPEPLVLEHLAAGRLQDVLANRYFDVPLYWQQWTLDSRSLRLLASTLQAHGAACLHEGAPSRV